MIELRLNTDALGRTTYGYSPLAEVVTSARLLFSAGPAGLRRVWSRETQGRLEGVDLELLRAAIPPKPNRFAPRFLHSSCSDPRVPFGDWIAKLVELDPRRVHEDVRDAWVGRAPPAASRLGRPDGPRRLAAAVEAYWDVALAPYWPGMSGVLQKEVRERSVTTSTAGSYAALSDLHPTVTLEHQRLLIRKPHTQLSRTVESLTLVPSIFVWPHVGVIETSPSKFTVVYPAHGFGLALDAPTRTNIGCALDNLLGSTRAGLLRHLNEPATTTNAARSLGMSPATINRHFSILREAGLVTAERQGREVRYRRTRLGAALSGGDAVDGRQSEIRLVAHCV